MSGTNGRTLLREPIEAQNGTGRAQSRRITEEIEDELRIHLRRQFARTGRVNIKAALFAVLGKLGGGRDHEIASRLADEMGFPRVRQRRARKADTAPTLAFPEIEATPDRKRVDPDLGILSPWVVVVSPEFRGS